MVPRIMPFCGSAKTSRHNIVFLEGVKAALTADAAWKDGWYDEQPWRGLRAAARVYAGWGFSQAFYWDEVYERLGHTSLEDFLVGFWEGFFLDERDANNLLTMLWTWQHGDIGMTDGFGGDTERALRSIQARAIVMPAEKDLYFPPEDNAWRSNACLTPSCALFRAYGVISQAVAPILWTPRSSTGVSRIYWQTEPARAREVIVRR
jgi:homoserine O-acetyltransferase